MSTYSIIIALLLVSIGACTTDDEPTHQEPTVRAEKAYVYYLWGQSNMAGITKSSDWSDIDAEQEIYDGSMFKKQSPEDFSGSPYTNSGIELQLGGYLKERHTDGDVFFVKRAIGSTSVAWHWNIVTSTSGRGAELIAYKEDIVNAHQLLEELGYTIEPQLLLSFIGESDSVSPTSATNFEDNYLATIASIQETIGQDVPVVAYDIDISEEAQLSFPLPHVDEVRAQYGKLQQRGVRVIATDDVERASDGIHVTRAGYRQLQEKGI